MKAFCTAFLLIIAVITCCTHKEASRIKSAQEEQNLINEEVKKYAIENSAILIDSLNYGYSFKYQDLIMQKRSVLFHDVKINDIAYKDSVLIISFKNDHSPDMFVDLKCDSQRAKDLSDNLTGDERKFLILCKLSKVKKLNFEYYKAPSGVDELGELIYSTDAEPTNTFYATGELIDYRILQDK